MTTLHTNPQPFDLNRALNGEPVLLRNGNKAFVKFKMRKPDNDVLVGVAPNKSERVENLRQWWLDGTVFLSQEKENDIVGMWQDPNIISLHLTLKRNGRVIGERMLKFENDLAATRYLDFLEYAKNLFERVNE